MTRSRLIGADLLRVLLIAAPLLTQGCAEEEAGEEINYTGNTSPTLVADASLDGTTAAPIYTPIGKLDGAVNVNPPPLPGDASVAGDGSVQTDGSAPVVTGPGGFPRASEMPNVELKGPYEVASYTMGLDDPKYRNPIIYYPKNATPPFAAVSLSLGFTESRSALEWWGNVLASHGIASFHVDPTSASDFPNLRAEDLAAQVDKLKAENQRMGSPLQGKIDLARLGLMGHSMGGGGTLEAAAKLGSEIKAIAPLQPWHTTKAFASVKAASLVIGAENDGTAPHAQHAEPFYKSITTSKIYAELKGASHMAGTSLGPPGAVQALQARIVLAWMKRYLEDDTRYDTYLTGDEHKQDAAKFSQWLTGN